MRPFTKRLAAALLIGAYFGAVSGCSSEGTASNGEASQSTDPSNGGATLTLEPWEQIPGLEGGSLKSLTWSEGRLFAMSDAGVFGWTDDTAGFDLLPDAVTLSDVGLATSPSPLDAPEFGGVYGVIATHQLFAVVGGKLFRRDGDRWTDADEAAQSLTESVGTLYLRRKAEILTSHDGGDWATEAAIPSESTTGYCCSSPVGADPVRNRLYVFNDGGVFAYNLASKTWTALDVGDDMFQGPLTYLRALFVDPSNGDVYVGTLFDLYVSEDGQTWSAPLFKTQTGIWGTTIFALARDPATGLLYAATSRGVFSRLGKSAWTPLPVLGATPSALSAKDGILWAATDSGLWSFNGSAWTLHEPKGLTTKTIEAMEFTGGFLYAQSDELVSGTLPGSDDVGATFHVLYKQTGPGAWTTEQRLSSLTKSSPVFDPDLETTAFVKLTINSKDLRVAATPKGVLFSLKNGPWTLGNEGLPTFRVTSFAYDSFTQTLYAGTVGHGAFRLSLTNIH